MRILWRSPDFSGDFCDFNPLAAGGTPAAWSLANKQIMVAQTHFLEQREAQSHSGCTMTRGVRVWLVDDDDSFRELLASLLQLQEGVTCDRQFASAELAIEALTREPAPDVILLDVQMKGLSGLDAIRPIKQLAANTRIFMLTAFYDSQRRARALREGATDFLVKIDTVEKISRQIKQNRIPLEEEDLRWRSKREDAVPSDRDESAAGGSSVWPTRRASTPLTRPSVHRQVTKEPPESGRRSRLWHGASEGLVRGVAFLAALLGLAPEKGGDAQDHFQPNTPLEEMELKFVKQEN